MRVYGRGFSLIEVLVAVAIMASLATVGIGVAAKVLNRQRLDKEQETLDQIGKVVERYYADTGVWPADSDGAGDSSRKGLEVRNLTGFARGPALEPVLPLRVVVACSTSLSAEYEI